MAKPEPDTVQQMVVDAREYLRQSRLCYEHDRVFYLQLGLASALDALDVLTREAVSDGSTST